MNNFSIEISSVPDREYLVAEIWFNDTLVAEINQEKQELELEIYCEFKKINLPFNDFLIILQNARDKLTLRK